MPSTITYAEFLENMSSNEKAFNVKIASKEVGSNLSSICMTALCHSGPTSAVSTNEQFLGEKRRGTRWRISRQMPVALPLAIIRDYKQSHVKNAPDEKF